MEFVVRMAQSDIYIFLFIGLGRHVPGAPLEWECGTVVKDGIRRCDIFLIESTHRNVVTLNSIKGPSNSTEIELQIDWIARLRVLDILYLVLPAT